MGKNKLSKLLFFIMFTSIFILCSLNSEDLIKRKIVIIPFNNQNNNQEFNYLSDTIRDALRAKLQGTDLFVIESFSEVDKLTAKVSSEELVKNEDKAISLALKLKSDVIITGKFIVIEDKVMIMANAIDVLQQQSVISSTVNGETGINLFSLIDQISIDMTNKISKVFTKVDKTLLEELLAEQEKKFKKDTTFSTEEDNKVKEKVKNDNEEKKYENFDKASKALRTVAIISVASGSGVSLLFGLTFTLAGYTLKNYYEENKTEYYTYASEIQTMNNVMIAGIVILAVGLSVDVISIPLFIASGVLRYKYNKYALYNIKPFFETNFKELSVGFAMRL